jgi:hypothetical protein
MLRMLKDFSQEFSETQADFKTTIQALESAQIDEYQDQERR